MTNYDYIIVGGGIAGLYTAYNIQKREQQPKILILEKYNNLGGRIQTKTMNNAANVECGAGRFSNQHARLLQLLKDFGLSHKIMNASSNVVFIADNSHGKQSNSLLDLPGSSNCANLSPVFDITLDAVMGPTLPISGLVTKIIIASNVELPSVLREQTFEMFGVSIVGAKNMEYIKQGFGYSTEITTMNAYDACKIIQSLGGPFISFYVLRDGLSQLIHKLAESVVQRGARIFTKKTVTSIKHINNSNETGFVVKCEDGINYKSRVCICTLPRPALQKLAIFHPYKSILNKIYCGPLCRIYSQFAPDDNGKVWFHNLPKFTTNNLLRMVIPISEKAGTIMVSYTDNDFARTWKRIYDKRGVDGVNKLITDLMYSTTDIMIPRPKKTVVYYWDCGVGYWGVGAKSKAIQDRIIKPFDDKELYVCGENYSYNNQQWIEGSLDTSEMVIENIFSHTDN